MEALRPPPRFDRVDKLALVSSGEETGNAGAWGLASCLTVEET